MRIVTKGSPSHIRYAIRNGETTWDGKEWSTSKPLLFYTPEEAQRQMAKLREQNLKNKTVTRYTASVEVQLYSDKPLTNEELQNYLAETAKLTLKTPAPKGSVAHVSINWATLEKQDQKDNA